MDSSGVYESEDGSDIESCFSGEEQVIEISSHSRIIVSPRKVGSSAWDEKSQRSSSRRTTAIRRKEISVQGVRRNLGSPSNRSIGRARRPQKSRSDRSNQRSSPSRRRTLNKKSNNHEDLSSGESDSGSEEIDSSGSDDSDGSSDGSDVSLEDVIKKPGNRQTPKQEKEAQRSRSKFAAKSLGDSKQSLHSPATPGKEMDDLKATLKKLAQHDDNDNNPAAFKIPNISSTTALREYLTAATAVQRAHEPAGQTRLAEFANGKSLNPLFQPPRSTSSYISAALLPGKTVRIQDNDMDGKQQDHPVDKLLDAADSSLSTGSERFSRNKKLYGVPPPPSKMLAGLAAGSSVPFQSSTTGSAQGSRAMLSALKALQDKIGRLEEERETLKQQLSDTNLLARKREAELVSSEKKFSYELGQTKESARAAYDALRCDREEMKLQLVKSEERKKATQAELLHFQELTKTLSEKVDDLQSQLQISEAHRTRTKNEMKEAENDHKRIVEEVQSELTSVRQELQSAVERNELLETQFQRESSNFAECKERLRDSEQTAASLSQLNEKLVTKVWEATEAANQAIKKNKKLLQQQRPSTLLKPTAASRASAAAASEATAKRRGTTTSSQGSTGLSSTRTVKKKKSTTGASSSTSKKTKQPKSANNMTLLREANFGKEIPFLLGSSAQKSFSLIGNVQDALRRCDTTYAMPTLHASAPTTPAPVWTTGSILSQTPHREQDAEQINGINNDTDPVTNIPHSLSTPTTQSSPTADELVAMPTSETPLSTPSNYRHTAKHKPPAITVPTDSPKTYASPMQNQIMDDLGAAVEAADKEFKTLNKRYKDLVAQMEANSRRGSSGDSKSGSTSSQLSQALGPLLDELEAKAKQLNLLKQVYQQAANSTINPPRHVVVSPEAIRRKTASMRLLHEYRQLESDCRNKGSGRSASPSCHLGANGFFH